MNCAVLALAMLHLLLGNSPCELGPQDGLPATIETADSAAFSVMRVLHDHNLHDVGHERWNVYGQLTYISNWKLPFAAAYTNLGGVAMSLLPGAERAYTATLTLYAGARLWRGAELQVVPEVISLMPLSHLAGLGGAIVNFELQKTGSQIPTLYLSRAYLRQTIELGYDLTNRSPGMMQLGGGQTSRRLVITLGKLSILDVFDKNTFAADLRNQYLNMAFMTHSAFDFAADARGYSYGGMFEFYFDAWALRFAHMMVPLHPNQLAIDVRIWRVFGQQLELEHGHTLFGRPGVVRLLGYRNMENSGSFDEALAAYRQDAAHNAARCSGFSYGSQNAHAPDLCWVRRPNARWGIGLNLEQYVAQDIGLFVRGMVSDGETEVYSYTSSDHSVSAGALAHGGFWHRPLDVFGLAWGQGFISKSHAAYLNAGGVDGFVGDGRIRRAPESVLECFYSVNAYETIWLTADYQHIWNPAYNADRGPVDVFSGRLHAEF